MSSVNYFGISNSINAWGIYSLFKTNSLSINNDLQKLETSMALTLENEDRYVSSQSPVLMGLYRAIPSERAEQLLSEGYSDVSAIVKAVSEYMTSIEDTAVYSEPTAQNDRTFNINDPAPNTSTYDLVNLYNNTVNINTNAGTDTVNLGGTYNTIQVDVGLGDDTVNVDTSSANEFTIVGGPGTNTVNMSGNVTDYAFQDNGDNTLTMTDTYSGATVVIDTNIELVNFADGSTMTFDGTDITINSAATGEQMLIDTTNSSYVLDMNSGDDTLVVSGVGNTVDVNVSAGNDFVVVDGTNNNVNIQFEDKQDTLYVATGNNNIVNVDGGDYTDSLILQGDVLDWTLVGNTYTHNTTGTAVTVNDIENVYFGQLVDDPAGSSSNLDYTALNNSGNVVYLNDGNDTVALGGTNNYIQLDMGSGTNTVTIDDTNYNNFVLAGGSGTDTISFIGNVGDYTFQTNDDGTLTIKNASSFATTTIDSNIENILFADNSSLAFNGTDFSIKTTINADTVNITGSNNTVFIDTYNGADSVSITGTNNTVKLNLANDDDSVYVGIGENNDITIDGAHGVDTLTLQGMAADWTLTGTLPGQTYYENIYSGTKVTILTSIDNVQFDNGLVVYDTPGMDSFINALGYNDTSININTNDGDDTVSLDGTNNNVTVNFLSGNDYVHIDDSTNSTYFINGGSGEDTVVLNGVMADYNIVNNPDDTMTITNTISGAAVTLDPYLVENIVLMDGPIQGRVVLRGTPLDDTFDLTAFNNETIQVDLMSGNDLLTVGGTNNDIDLNLGAGDDIVNIDDSNSNIFNVSGGLGNDIINMAGVLGDYTFTDNGDSTFTLTNVISGAATTVDSTVETINLGDGSVLSYDGSTITITDAPGRSNTFDMTTYSNSSFIINANDQDDMVIIGGLNNDITANLNSGNNTVNIDDSNIGTYTVNGGTGTDVINMAGNLSDYQFNDNGDSTFTLTNVISGATTTINSTVETINLNDGTVIGYDGSTITITDGLGNSSNIDLSTSNNTSFIINAGDSDDVVNLAGTNNNAIVNLSSGTNTLNIDDSNNNTFVVNGGVGIDTASLSGVLADYTFTDNGDNTLTVTNTGSGATTTIDIAVENINLSDGSIVNFDGSSITITDAPGNASNFDLTGGVNTVFTINANDNNDTVDLGGLNNDVTVNLNSGNNTVNVDDTNNNTFVISGGSGTDVVNMSGNVSDYTFIDNGDNTLTLTNNISGATTTIDTSIETVTLGDNVNVNFDGSTITLTDALGSSTTFDLTAQNNSNMIINTGNMDDIVNLGGSNNDMTVNLISGNNNVNISDQNFNTFIVNGGTATDTVNFTAGLDYTLTDNGDTTYTVTNNLSGANTTFGTSIETISFTDIPGSSSTFSVNDSFAASIIVNAGNNNDTLNLGGAGNDITANLNSGTNVVNVDDTVSATYNINGGSGTDSINLTGILSDYSFQDNGDSTLTITNTLSGATVTVDANIETINLADGKTLSYDGTDLTINDTPGSSSAFDITTFTNTSFIINTDNQNDIVDLGGNNNTAVVNLASGVKTVNIDDSNNNTFVVNGGVGTDTINLFGNISDYSFQDNGDSTLTITNTLSGATVTVDANIETINLADGKTLNYDGTDLTINDLPGSATNFDITSNANTSFIINAGDQNDIVDLGGNNNTAVVNLTSGVNTVNIDDSNSNTFVVNGGVGTDTINMSANFSDYILMDNLDGTLTITNNISGATTTIDSSIETVNFNDSYSISYDGSDITLSGFTAGNDNLSIDGIDTTYNFVTTDAGMDNITIDGINNNVNIDLGTEDDSVYVAVGNNNVINIDGSGQTDTLTLEGAALDWNLVGSTYTHTVSGTSVTISNLENVLFTA
ncbi:MAG: hypothetical protein AB1782_08235 [Cyanobacteriota bacterium]